MGRQTVTLPHTATLSRGADELAGRHEAECLHLLSRRSRYVKVMNGSEAFNSSALEAIKKWMFKPAVLEGKPASSVVPVAFSFSWPVACAQLRHACVRFRFVDPLRAAEDAGTAYIFRLLFAFYSPKIPFIVGPLANSSEEKAERVRKWL